MCTFVALNSVSVLLASFPVHEEWPGTHCSHMRKNLWKMASNVFINDFSHMAISSTEAVYEYRN